MILSNKVYDALKWIVMIAIPALTTAYVGLSGIWGWPYAEEVAKTSAVVCGIRPEVAVSRQRPQAVGLVLDPTSTAELLRRRDWRGGPQAVDQAGDKPEHS